MSPLGRGDPDFRYFYFLDDEDKGEDAMSKQLLFGAVGAALLATLLLVMGIMAFVSPAVANGTGT